MALPVAFHFTNSFSAWGVSPAVHAHALSRSAKVMQMIQLATQMTQVSEITEQEYTSQELQKQSGLKTLASMATMLLKNPRALRTFRLMGPDEERYVRPPREYQIPPFHEDMKYCASNEQYLRPTRWCNPREPEVIALANELGAFELSDHEFAEAAYWFVKTKMAVEFCPLDSVSATLERGTGTCYHLLSVFIALCRAAGIKARYKTFMMKLPEEILNTELSEQEEKTMPMFNMGMPEGEGEAYIDGEWVVGHLAMRPELLAVFGLPITKFGEDAMGLTFKLIPGTIKRFESIPLRLGIALKAGVWLAPASMERATIGAQARLPTGRQIIKEAGGIEAYDQKAREKVKLSSSVVIEVKHSDAIVFEE
jgi:hypothetical protein